MKISVSLSVILIVSAAFAEKRSFDRYQPIVDRQMFGAPPPGFDPTKLPSEVSKADQKQLTQEQEKLQSSIHFSVINVTPEGETAVGFSDNSDPKAPKHYFLRVGEERDGWKVKTADPDKATMTISKNDIEVSLSLGGNSASDGSATTKASAAAPAAPAAASRGGLLSGTLKARRLLKEKREQEERAKAEAREAERREQAAAEKAERDEQLRQLQDIQQNLKDELKRVREAKGAKAEEPSGAESNETD